MGERKGNREGVRATERWVRAIGRWVGEGKGSREGMWEKRIEREGREKGNTYHNSRIGYNTKIYTRY